MEALCIAVVNWDAIKATEFGVLPNTHISTQAHKPAGTQIHSAAPTKMSTNKHKHTYTSVNTNKMCSDAEVKDKSKNTI